MIHSITVMALFITFGTFKVLVTSGHPGTCDGIIHHFPFALTLFDVGVTGCTLELARVRAVPVPSIVRSEA